MNTLNPYFAVTLVVFAVYLLLALFGSRERGAEFPHQLRAWALRAAHFLRKQSYSRGANISRVSVRLSRADRSKPHKEHPWKS